MARILVVDDMSGIRRSLAVILVKMGHEVMEADNGLRALDILKQDGDFDLVITDVLMPEGDGVGLMLEMKKLPKQPKVIAISGGGNKVTIDDAVKVSSNFADKVLRKPFQRDDLVGAVNEVLLSA